MGGVAGGGGGPTEWWQPVVLGGLAGSMAEMTAMPCLVVRTRLMVQGVGPGTGLTVYGGLFDCVRTMYRQEGIGAFYKGGMLNAASTPPARGAYMAGVEVSRATIGGGTASKDFAAGALAQLISSLAYVPRDVIIERCAIDGQLTKQHGSASSSMSVLRTIWAQEGARGFYRAYIPHQFVWIPYNGMFFALLGKLVEEERAHGIDASLYGVGVFNTACSAAVSAWVTTPIDVIKTRCQVQGANPELFAFKGPLGCLMQLLKNEGPKALFSGASGRIAYLVPNMALFLPLYDLLKSATNARKAAAAE